ncbi:MAG: N-acetylgalactosamine-6-sulfatase [Planctomycetaceae bacterium]|nr:MAG: N-acetylgalactosamine-6-sulfatase [Planctomycetaceae bacterium]
MWLKCMLWGLILSSMGMSLAHDRPPNIVVMLADDAGWGDFSIHGNRTVRTPNIDALGQAGAVFERFYVCPLCAPTRAEFLTGRYHPRGGVTGVSLGRERLDLQETTLADSLRQAGYATGIFGKWHNGSQGGYHPLARGFQFFTGYTEGHWAEYFDPWLEHQGDVLRKSGYIVEICTDEALRFMERHVSQPFFCYLPFTTPHTPWSVPEDDWRRWRDRPILQSATMNELEDLDETRCALAMIEHQDRQVGRVLQKLRDLGLEEQTIVVYFSDNGPNTWRWNGNLRGRKGSTDEGGTRSICVLRWPGKIPAGRRVSTIAAAIDLLPTLLSLAGVTHVGQRPVDGQDLSPLLMGADVSWPERLLFSHNNGLVSVRGERFCLDAQGRLYDLVQDPGQTRPVNAEYPQIMAQLRSAVQIWRREVLGNERHPLPQPRQDLDPRPFPVGGQLFANTWLPARDARAVGNIQRSSPAPNSSYFVNWSDIDDHIVWQVEVKEAGTYRVTLYYTCSVADAGAELELCWHDRTLRGKVQQAYDPGVSWFQDTLPRPLAESPAKRFRALDLGTIDLTAGQGELRLRAVHIPGREVMHLRGMMLTRMTGI